MKFDEYIECVCGEYRCSKCIYVAYILFGICMNNESTAELALPTTDIELCPFFDFECFFFVSANLTK